MTDRQNWMVAAFAALGLLMFEGMSGLNYGVYLGDALRPVADSSGKIVGTVVVVQDTLTEVAFRGHILIVALMAVVSAWLIGTRKCKGRASSVALACISLVPSFFWAEWGKVPFPESNLHVASFALRISAVQACTLGLLAMSVVGLLRVDCYRRSRLLPALVCILSALVLRLLVPAYVADAEMPGLLFFGPLYYGLYSYILLVVLAKEDSKGSPCAGSAI